jgi:hypothetical protein
MAFQIYGILCILNQTYDFAKEVLLDKLLSEAKLSQQVRHVDRPERDELGDGLVVAVAVSVARRRSQDVLDRRDDFRRRERGENDFRKNSGNQFGFREKVSVPPAAERTGSGRGFPESGRFR